MTTAIEVPTEKLSITMGSFRDVLKRPLLLLPESVRPAALRLWTCNRHLAGLETPIALAGRVSLWIEEYGLEPQDAAELLNGMLSPEASEKHRFASDLLADLASSVKERIRFRRKSNANKQTLENYSNLQPTPRPEIDKLLAGIGEMPKG